MDITILPKLVSLDLSWNDLKLESHVFYNLLHNSTSLEDLSLKDINISSILPIYLNISSSMKSLILLGTGLFGSLPGNIFNLPYLEELDLASNINLIGRFSKVYINTSIPLKWLDLSGIDLSGEIPDSISNLGSLIHLDLSRTDLSGKIPNSIGRLESLNYLSLFGTNLSGEIPDSIGHLESLNYLSLLGTSLSGEIPDSIGRLKSLIFLDLSSTNLSGEISDSIGHLESLTSLDLSYTKLSREISDAIGHLKSLNSLRLSSINLSSRGIFDSIVRLKSLNSLSLDDCSLMGPLPKSIVNLRHLTHLDLSNNKINGTLPSWLFTIPSLERLDLSNNMFSGSLPTELFNHQSLRMLSLGGNQFIGGIDMLDQGSTMQAFWKLINLNWLDLSFNNFTGVWELDTVLSSLTNIGALDLSYSGLSVVTNNDNHYVNPSFVRLGLASCNLKVFPKSLMAMKNLMDLDLSNNEIHGNIPNWAGEIGGHQLYYLNLSHNFVTSLPQLPWDGLSILDMHSNLIEGSLPPSICNMRILRFLDMSKNSFDGVIPQCIGNISSYMRMVDLGSNSFHGVIPNTWDNCGRLEGLILNDNSLEGEVPSGLSKCESLKVLDLGNNYLNGTFPHWSGLLPLLQVLVLKSNRFHGPIESSSMIELMFQGLRVLDLSQNNFVGHLPQKYFQNFNSMKDVVKSGKTPQYLRLDGVKFYSITLVVKGLQLLYPKVLVDYTIINLSDNKFEGKIPNVIGSLNSMKALNLSHNNLDGQIPYALGNLLDIESMDLSWNRLTGEIPQSLANITTLEVLNISQNRLVGRIPSGTQFSTFSTSFGGNLGLCGFPLPMNCKSPSTLELEVDGDEESGFTWKVVMLGYGCGTILGLVLGYIMLCTGWPKWFNAIADELEQMVQRRRKKRIYIIYGEMK